MCASEATTRAEIRSTERRVRPQSDLRSVWEAVAPTRGGTGNRWHPLQHILGAITPHPSFCFRLFPLTYFFSPAVWQIIHFSTGVLPLIPQTSMPSSRSDNRIVSVQSISGVSLISYGNRASICWKLILGCDIVLIAILSPDAATQTNLVFGGSERTRPPDNAERKYIEGPSVCHSPTLYPLLSLAFTNTAMILKNLTFQAGTPHTPTYRYTLPFYFVHTLSQQTCVSVRAFRRPLLRRSPNLQVITDGD